MKKNTILAIVVLVAVVVAFSFLPLSSAKKPPIATVTLTGAVTTVDNCDNKNPLGVDLGRGSKGFLETTAAVTVVLNFGNTHIRDHEFGVSNEFVLPGCHVADHLGQTSFRVRLDGTTLIFVQLIGLDLTPDHREGFAFVGDREVDDPSFDSFLQHNHRDTGKKSDRAAHVEFAFSGNLAITGDLS